MYINSYYISNFLYYYFYSMKPEKSLPICQKPSDIRRYLETHSKFLEAILTWTEDNIHRTIYNIITPQDSWYPSANKEFLEINEKISALNQHIPYVNIWKLKSKIYETLDRYKNLDIENISFNELSNKISINQQLISWIFKDWPENLAENVFGETADQRFEQEKLWLSSQIRISHFHNGWSDHTTKNLPEWYFVDKAHKIYKRNTTTNTYTIIEWHWELYLLAVVDYDEQLWIFSSKSRIDEKNSLNIFYKLFSFQNNTIQSVDDREYLDVKFDQKYMSFVNKDDGIIHIIMHSDEGKTEYKLQAEEENLNDIQDIFYSKEDDCILVYSNSWASPSYYLVFGDWTIFSDFTIDLQYYEHIVFEKWKLEFIAPYQKQSFFDRLTTKKTPDYLSKYDEWHVHHIDLKKLHKFLQK